MSDSEDEFQRTVKISVVGEPNTGKSSLCMRYLGIDGGSVAVSETRGAEVRAGRAAGLRPPVPLHLCDVAGNALDTHMFGNYLYGSHIVLFVYDLTNLQSFERLTVWLSTVKEHFGTDEKMPLMALFGNKSDLEHQRAVRLSCVQKFASEHLLESFKGSARTGEMVAIAFTSLVVRLLGIKVNPLLPVPVPSRSPKSKNIENSGQSHIHTEPTEALIMNRKTLRRRIQIKSSQICSLQ